MAFVYGNFNTICLSDCHGQWGTVWLALERKKAAHKGLTTALSRQSAELTTKKGRLRIIHGNYRGPLKTSISKPLDFQARILLSLSEVIELRLLRYKYRKRTVKVIVDIRVLTLVFFFRHVVLCWSSVGISILKPQTYEGYDSG